ncbi:26S proteasome non-ATPase regulatory subunit 12 [Platysternon megacephalum]|uniref:26S proteasome non-ATPase regulatory subunit 12 n=1 Tax=Platysternon megacephalum TaxID=55544 RepID=A0A4D9E1W2_9SAUR|nr:26S proteasome non-ATPase regulatory subunit 12 [Platysternon megacephalum]
MPMGPCRRKDPRRPGPAAPPLPGALLIALVGAGVVVCQPNFTLPVRIDNIAASGDSLLLAGGNCLYKLHPSLSQQPPARPHLAHAGAQDCARPAGTHSKLLLPDLEGGRLLTGWTLHGGSCQVRHLGNLTALSDQSEVVSCLPEGSTTGVLFAPKPGRRRLLALAATYSLPGTDLKCSPSASDDATVLTMRSLPTLGLTGGDLATLKRDANGPPLHFVDAFLWGEYLFFPYYPLPPAGHQAAAAQPSVAVLESQKEYPSLLGELRLDCGARSTLLSSSLLEQAGLWAGVFSAGPGERRWDSTALCIFGTRDMERLAKQSRANCHSSGQINENRDCQKLLSPVKKSPTLIHSDLSAVYATIVLNKTVLFLGTKDGQLLKAILNNNMEPNCPEILYEIEEESSVFPKLVLDPVDSDYIYLSFANEVRRIQVANCNKYGSCKQCLSAKDPHCGWCYLSKRCTLKGNCSHSNNSRDWVNISHEADKCLTIQIHLIGRKEIVVTAVGDVLAVSKRRFVCIVKDTKTNQELCKKEEPQIMNCSCNLSNAALINRDISAVEVTLISDSWNLSETFQLKNCSRCISTGVCAFCEIKHISPFVACKPDDSGQVQDDCHPIDKQGDVPATTASQMKATTQMSEPICNISIEPLWISVLGKRDVIIKGANFTEASNITVVLTGTSSCKQDNIQVSKVLNGTHIRFSLPPRRKEAKSVRIKANGRKCSPPITVYYVSEPSCTKMEPHKTWASGGRKITLFGRNFNVTDSVIISDDQRLKFTVSGCPGSTSPCSFLTPDVSLSKGCKNVSVSLKVENVLIPCNKLEYCPDPIFIDYQLHTEMNPHLELKLYKKNDNLDISENEIGVTLTHMMNDIPLEPIIFNVQNITKTTILCTVVRKKTGKIELSTVKVWVTLGNFSQEVQKKSSHKYLYVMSLLPILLLGVIVVAIIVTRYKSKQLTRKLSQQIELLEYEIRKKIRDGFAELQMDQLDVVDSFGTVPFLDYKHFALRTFFPESGGFASIFIEDMHTNVSRSRDPRQKDESLTMLHALICNEDFLVTLIHTLEKQKNFSVKDRCLFASFLTIALQSKLVYLTHILEVLTKDLMEQSSNTQPKLMLRRTESVVEKLLTNWMSVCLSGFLRETVGEPFYKLVTALNQRINKGPVDVITCKALYTLNEDWLLWQVTEFKPVALNVFFEKIPENESADTCLDIEVNVLDCDTIEQAKEKIFQAFLKKNGSLYGLQLSEIGLELQSGAQQKELLDIDGSSVILEDGITKLNTIGHYEISDGATIKVFKKKTNFTSDVEYSNKHCHLILPDSEEPQGAMHKGKQKFEVKEMYLTKLLSTKVAIHLVVENLFKSIWSLPNNKAPVAIKYFFDFLDAQAESKKITDPDVAHIWKTNSLPLRFWVNILKNPQFVFDIRKTPHIDGCLSVIAQAFMDAFSLTEQQLGKDAPTNKLLYAKDIPLYKEEVKAYYKAIRDLPLLPSEVEEFLTQESKKHENELNEDVALTEIYKYIARYYDEIRSKLERERGLEDAQKDLLHIKALFDEKKKCKWM